MFEIWGIFKDLSKIGERFVLYNHNIQLISSGEMSYILKIYQLTKSFQESKVVSRVNIHVKKGKIRRESWKVRPEEQKNMRKMLKNSDQLDRRFIRL